LEKIYTNKVYNHLKRSDKKIVVEQGGTRSGKTYNILLWVIFHYSYYETDKTITICRKTFPALRASVMRDFFDILRSQDLYNENFHNKSSHEYYLNGNLVEFISLDQPQKIRGRKRDLLYINEANELTYEDWQQLILRTEGKAILDYNPSDAFHWIYDKVVPREDCAFYQTTYLDNPFLDAGVKAEIERLKDTDEDYWRIYGLGERGMSRATIFQFGQTDIPQDATLLAYGMDFGYTNDPTALADSVIVGIDVLKRHKIFVTPRSNNLIKEMQNYKWVEDKNGNLLNKPIDAFNHAIDAVRYATYNKLSRPNYGRYAIR
jgi:phage terminase large subunit